MEEDTELRDIVLETLEQRGVVGRTKVGIPSKSNHPILNLIYNNHHLAYHTYLLIISSLYCHLIIVVKQKILPCL